MQGCEIVDAPRVDGDVVLLRVLDKDTGRVFTCHMQGFGHVVVEPMMGTGINIPPPTAEERTRVAEFARAYAEERDGHFEGLFSQLPHRKDWAEH